MICECGHTFREHAEWPEHSGEDWQQKVGRPCRARMLFGECECAGFKRARK